MQPFHAEPEFHHCLLNRNIRTCIVPCRSNLRTYPVDVLCLCQLLISQFLQELHMLRAAILRADPGKLFGQLPKKIGILVV